MSQTADATRPQGVHGGSLFLALLPDDAARTRLAALSRELAGRIGPTARPLAPERLHLTLAYLGRFPSIPQNVLDATSRAASSLMGQAPLAIRLDRITSFRTRGPKPVVLTGDDAGMPALVGFQRQLARALARYGLAPDRRFKPHVTLLRDPQGAPPGEVAPVAWTAHEMHLLHSPAGPGPYRSLACWRLDVPVGPPAPAPEERFDAQDQAWMRRALALAAQAGEALDEVPVGAVLVGPDGRVLAEASNLTGDRHDPTAHAEMQVLAAAGRALGSARLRGCRLFVSLEPCPMCAAALVHARVDELVFAASSPKTGAAGSVFDDVRPPQDAGPGAADRLDDHRHNHAVRVRGGLLAREAGDLLAAWFRGKRGARE